MPEKPLLPKRTTPNNRQHDQEYHWEIEVYLENYILCFTPNGFCRDLRLDLCQI